MTLIGIQRRKIKMEKTRQTLTDEQKKLIDEIPLKPLDLPGIMPDGKPNTILNGLVEWGNSLDFNALPEGAVIVVKIGIDDPAYGQQMQMRIVRQILEPRVEILKEKKVAVLFMSTDDDIKVLTEEDLNAIGYTRKDRSRIIIPGS
jgi:hypothetical protein